MNKIAKILTISIGLFTMVACNNEAHFITDKEYRNQVESDYADRILTQERRTELDKIINDPNIALEQKEALKFLYAYMPLSDIADYSADFFLDQGIYHK